MARLRRTTAFPVKLIPRCACGADLAQIGQDGEFEIIVSRGCTACGRLWGIELAADYQTKTYRVTGVRVIREAAQP